MTLMTSEAGRANKGLLQNNSETAKIDVCKELVRKKVQGKK